MKPLTHSPLVFFAAMLTVSLLWGLACYTFRLSILASSLGGLLVGLAASLIELKLTKG